MAEKDLTTTSNMGTEPVNLLYASKSSLSVSAMEFVPTPSKLSSAGPRSSDSDMIRIIGSTIAELQSCPEEFYDAAATIKRELTSFIIDERSYQAVVDHLFDQCIHYNFQYNGARLCAHLATHLNKDYNGNFRAHLLRRCAKEFSLTEQHIKTVEGQKTLTGFTMFLAELMSTLTVQGKILEIFPPRIVGLLSTLLRCCTEDCMTCIFRVLKISGLTLDALASSDMEKLFAELKQALVDGPVPTTASQRKKIVTLIELRAAKWIQEDPQTTSLTNPYANFQVHSNLPDDSNEVVYYEEDQFGVAEYYQHDSNYYSGDQAYNDEVHQYPGYDPSVHDYPLEGGGYQDGQAYIAEGHGYNNGTGNHFEEELWQGAPENFHIVYNDDVPYVIDATEDDEMDPEMIEAFEQFMVEKESREEKTNREG